MSRRADAERHGAPAAGGLVAAPPSSRRDLRVRPAPGIEHADHVAAAVIARLAAPTAQATAGPSVASMPAGGALVIRRALSADRTTRLQTGIGKNKYAKIVAAGQEEYFDGLTDEQLEKYKGMRNTAFDEVVEGLREGLGGLAGRISSAAAIADLLGAAIETGDDAAEVAALLPQLLARLSGAVPALADTGAESFGGGVGGIKDTIEGGQAVYNQYKPVEGLLTVASGVSSLAGMVGPDMLGMAAAGAKSIAGVTKTANAVINQMAITRLRAECARNPAMLAALDVLEGKISYVEGLWQAGSGAIEGTGAYFGGVGKWGASLLTKGVETLGPLAGMAGRAIGSTVAPSYIDSNAKVNEREQQESAEALAAMRAAVESVEGAGGNPTHIGRLRRLAVLIDPALAEEIDRAVALLRDPAREAVLEAIQKANTWNPS